MPSDDDEELEGMLRNLREQASDRGFDPARVWALAAGELPAAEAAQVAASVYRSREALAELGIAMHLLDDRDSDADAGGGADAGDVEAVMRRIGVEQAARRRRLRMRRIAGLGCVAAAAAAAVLLMLRSPGLAPLPVTITEVAKAEARGGAASGLQFRVHLEPPQPLHAVLYLLEGEGGRRALLRRHPPVAAVLAEPEYATWPRNPLPVGPVTLPHRAPPDLNLFHLDSSTGFAIVCWSDRAFTEDSIATIATAIQQSLPTALTEDGIVAALAGLDLPQVQITVRSVTP